MERTSVTLLLVCMFVCCVVQASEITVTTAAESEDVVKEPSGREGAEKEVLGPLRVWHITFLVSLIVVIAVVVACCCVEWRIPRTRQEIEDTYRQRQMNQKYLRQLERTPDAVLNRHNNNNVTEKHDSGTDHSKPRGARLSDLQLPQNKRHPHRQRQQQREQQQKTTGSSSTSAAGRNGGGGGGGGDGGNGGVGVAVTDTSARMARLARSQMPQGVQSPFAVSAIAALKKQKGQQRQQT